MRIEGVGRPYESVSQSATMLAVIPSSSMSSPQQQQNTDKPHHHEQSKSQPSTMIHTLTSLREMWVQDDVVPMHHICPRLALHLLTRRSPSDRDLFSAVDCTNLSLESIFYMLKRALSLGIVHTIVCSPTWTLPPEVSSSSSSGGGAVSLASPPHLTPLSLKEKSHGNNNSVRNAVSSVKRTGIYALILKPDYKWLVF